MSRVVATLLVALGACALAGCASLDQAELSRHRVDVVSSSLADEAASPDERRGLARLRPDGAPVVSSTLDVVVHGYEGDARFFLDAALDGLEKTPGLAIRRLTVHGLESARARRRESEEPGEVSVDLRCRAEFHGRGWNPLVAFPGMIAFLPVWLGYSYDLDLTLEAMVVARGRSTAVTSSVAVSFRERNARRSAIFHVWPSTGFFGTLFVLGLVLSPTFWFYDGEQATPALVLALGARLEDALVRPIVDALATTP